MPNATWELAGSEMTGGPDQRGAASDPAPMQRAAADTSAVMAVASVILFAAFVADRTEDDLRLPYHLWLASVLSTAYLIGALLAASVVLAAWSGDHGRRLAQWVAYVTGVLGGLGLGLLGVLGFVAWLPELGKTQLERSAQIPAGGLVSQLLMFVSVGLIGVAFVRFASAGIARLLSAGRTAPPRPTGVVAAAPR